MKSASLILIFCTALAAQTDTGRILGSVYDQSQAVVANATVIITDAERGTTRSLTTNESGDYAAPNLLAGVYHIRAFAPGFKNVERRNVELGVAKDVRVDFTLETGDTQTTITVTEEAPLLDSTSAVLGGTLSNQVINDLPLNGRNFMGLLQLRPGVMIFPGGGKWSQSTNGMRVDHNVYIIDGIDAIEGFSAQSAINGSGISGDTSSMMPVDAIQEFNTQQNPKAEYGWKPGAIVNVGLKSGANSVHGTAYAFGRDSALDARNPFLTAGLPKQETALEQFGATVGGPLRRNKLFYFGAYEGQRELIGAPQAYLVPTTASLGGNAANSIVDACNSVPAASRSALSLDMAGMNTQCAIVAPQQSIFQSGSSVSYVPVIPMDTHQDNGLVKLDYHLNEKHTLSGEYFISNYAGLATQNQAHDYWRTDTVTKVQLLGLHWTWLPSSRLVNEARFGFNRVYQFSTAGDCKNLGQPDSSYLHSGAQSCGFPQISIQGFSNLGCCSNFPKIQGPDYTFQGMDGLSYQLGKHSLKFGGELRRMIYNGGTYRLAAATLSFAHPGPPPPFRTSSQERYFGARCS